MLEVIRKESYENKEIVAFVNENLYIVRAYVNNVLVGEFGTLDKEEAQEVYAHNVYKMYGLDY